MELYKMEFICLDRNIRIKLIYFKRKIVLYSGKDPNMY